VNKKGDYKINKNLEKGTDKPHLKEEAWAKRRLGREGILRQGDLEYRGGGPQGEKKMQDSGGKGTLTLKGGGEITFELKNPER